MKTPMVLAMLMVAAPVWAAARPAPQAAPTAISMGAEFSAMAALWLYRHVKFEPVAGSFDPDLIWFAR